MIYSYSATPVLSEIDEVRVSLLALMNAENRINYLVDYLQLLPSKEYLPDYIFITYETSLLRMFCGYGLDVYASVTAPSFRKSPIVLHEAGHLFVQRFFGDADPSGKMHEFTSISWDLKSGGDHNCWSTGCEDGYVPKPGLCADPNQEFCRGFMTTYSLTNPDEDFAESYLFYIAYGDFFRELSKTDEIAKKKYEWMKTNVFNGREYTGSPFSLDNLKHHYMLGQRWSLIYSDEKKALLEYQQELTDLEIYSVKEENKAFAEYSAGLKRTVLSYIKFSCGRSNSADVQDICKQYDLSNVNVPTEHELAISDLANYE